jgi:hypothetical protein
VVQVRDKLVIGNDWWAHRKVDQTLCSKCRYELFQMPLRTLGTPLQRPNECAQSQSHSLCDLPIRSILASETGNFVPVEHFPRRVRRHVAAGSTVDALAPSWPPPLVPICRWAAEGALLAFLAFIKINNLPFFGESLGFEPRPAHQTKAKPLEFTCPTF